MKGSLLNTFPVTDFSNTQRNKYQSIVIESGGGKK
jgi:hypothetical protein